MVLEYAVPWWALFLMALAALVAAAAAYARPAVPLTRARRACLVGLRLAALLLLALFLLRPMIVEPAPLGRDAIVPVLVDGSRSMRLEDTPDGSRIEAARLVLERQLMPALTPEFQTELFSFGESLAPAESPELTGDDRRSDLTAAIRAVAERYPGRPIAGIIVISDGGDTSDRDAATALEASSAPVYPVGVGSRQIARDREVLSLTAGEAALVNSAIELAVTAVSHGYGDAPLELRLLENGRPIQVRSARPPADGSPVRETFRASPRADAATVYTVEIPAQAGELAAENNTRSVLVRPPGARRRVLLVEGAPGYEHSFLKRALLQDEGIELDSVVRKGQNDRGEDTFYVQAAAARAPKLARGFPADREALFAYHALLLGNVEPDALTRGQLTLTGEFVAERGGGLLVFGASSFAGRGFFGTPLEEVLPVELTGRGGLARASAVEGEPNRIELTPEGEVHPIMQMGGTLEESQARWADVPPLAAVAPLGAPRAGAALLAVSARPDGGTWPVIAVHRYGRGRAMVFAGEAFWRWRMLRPSSDQGYEMFWRQAVRWLSAAAPGPISVAASGGRSPGDAVRLDITARDGEFAPLGDAVLRVRVAAPGGAVPDMTATRADGSGRYVAHFQPEQSGVYRVQVEARRGDTVVGTADEPVLVGGADPELTDPRLNDQVLRRLAVATGGRFLESEEDIERLPSLLKATAPRRLPPVRRDLWHNAWTFLLLIGLLSTEWTLRRRWGLR